MPSRTTGWSSTVRIRIGALPALMTRLVLYADVLEANNRDHQERLLDVA